MKKLKIPFSGVIELDAAQWAQYHGLGPAATDAQVKANVRSHVLNMLQQSAFLDEADATVTLRS
jgi:hypothetical protein